jgi:hypothetical protein
MYDDEKENKNKTKKKTKKKTSDTSTFPITTGVRIIKMTYNHLLKFTSNRFVYTKFEVRPEKKWNKANYVNIFYYYLQIRYVMYGIIKKCNIWGF